MPKPSHRPAPPTPAGAEPDDEPDTRKKLSERKKGVKFSDEHRKNMSIARTDPPQETRDKLSAYARNRTPEHQAKLNESARRAIRPKPGPCSPETKAKISAALKAAHARRRESKRVTDTETSRGPVQDGDQKFSE